MLLCLRHIASKSQISVALCFLHHRGSTDIILLENPLPDSNNNHSCHWTNETEYGYVCVTYCHLTLVQRLNNGQPQIWQPVMEAPKGWSFNGKQTAFNSSIIASSSSNPDLETITLISENHKVWWYTIHIWRAVLFAFGFEAVVLIIFFLIQSITSFETFFNLFDNRTVFCHGEIWRNFETGPWKTTRKFLIELVTKGS